MNKKSFFSGILIGVICSTLVLCGLRFFHPFGFHGRHWGGQEIKNRFKHELKLTPDQQEKLDPLLESFHEKMKASRKARLEDAKQAMDALDEQLFKSLNDDQIKKLKEMRERFDRMRENEDRDHGAGDEQGHRPPPPPPTED